VRTERDKEQRERTREKDRGSARERGRENAREKAKERPPERGREARGGKVGTLTVTLRGGERITGTGGLGGPAGA
jgi:hypothetical protein